MTKKHTTQLPKISREAALRELAIRKGLMAAQGHFRLEDYLFDKQLAFVLDPNPFKVAVTTRRAGKTIACVADLVYSALSNPACTFIYINRSRRDAKQVVWKEFKKLIDKFGIKATFNESELSITLANKSMIYLAGASDRTSIEDFRGLAIKKVYLDESQSFPDYIKELIDDVLAPALMDSNGSLVMIGTPGPIPSGYFYEVDHNPAWAHHSWSFFDNHMWPSIRSGEVTHQQMLDRELKRRGVTSEDPSIQREWYGKWIKDENSLVYKYNPLINDYNGLPQGDWTYILGVDIGFSDSDAIALLAYSTTSPNTYLLEERIEKQQDITSLVAQIEAIRARYDVTKIVIDTGGLGKKIAEEIIKRFQVPMVAAEKVRKVEYIELMNDALRTGRLKIKANSRFAQDSMKVEWDHDHSTPEKRVVSKRFHSDICDAVLYAWRESYSFSYQAPKEEPEFGTLAWSNKEADMMFNAELERVEREKEERGEPEEPELDLDNGNIQILSRPKGRYDSQFKKRRKIS